MNLFRKQIKYIWNEQGDYKINNYYKFFKLEFDNFEIDKLISFFVFHIRYDASYYSRDDWTNKDVNLKIRFKK